MRSGATKAFDWRQIANQTYLSAQCEMSLAPEPQVHVHCSWCSAAVPPALGHGISGSHRDPPSQRMLGSQPMSLVEASDRPLHQRARLKVWQGLGAVTGGGHRERLGSGRRPRDDTEDGKA